MDGDGEEGTNAWKVTEPDVYLYGEDIYGVHSITYGLVPGGPNLLCGRASGVESGAFAPFGELEAYAERQRNSGRPSPVPRTLPLGCERYAHS